MPELVQDATAILADLHIRVRSLESKYNLLGERVLMVNQNMIEEYKKTMKEIRMLNNDVREIKRETTLMKDAVREVTKELDGFAKKAQVRVLEKYVSLLSPMKFVTDDQLKREIEAVKKKNA